MGEHIIWGIGYFVTPESKLKTIKYTGKTIFLSFLSQFFSNCGLLKKEIYIKDI